jgi:hypothetical protein
MMTNRDEVQLRARALNVHAAAAVRPGQISSREAAKVLSGVMSWVARTSSAAAMHDAAAMLAAHDAAWSSSFRDLPVGDDGAVSATIQMMATVARATLELAGAENLRDALAFWASERDPGAWQALVGA